MTTKKIEPSTPLPWHIGMREGHNANMILSYSGADQYNDPHVCSVSGIWINQPIDKVRDCEGFANAAYIVAACNAYPRLEAERADLVAALRSMIAALEFNGIKADQYEKIGKARALLRQIEGAK